MKTKFKTIIEVLHIPNRDEWMIQRQYSDGGLILTDDNDGRGYTEDEAHEKAFKLRSSEAKATP